MLADDNSRKRYSGILLIESVVYLGLFALLFLALIQFYFTIGSSNQRSTANLLLQRTRIFLAEHTEETIRDSLSFDILSSKLDDDSGILRFETTTGYKEYYLENGVLKITDGVDIFPLTPPNTLVTRFRGEVAEDSGSNMYYLEIYIDLQNQDLTTVTQDLNFFYITP